MVDTQKILTSIRGKIGYGLLNTITKLPSHELLYIFRRVSLQNKLTIFSKISINKKIFILSKLSSDEIEDFIISLGTDEIATILKKAPLNVSIKILRCLDEHKRKKVIKILPDDIGDFILAVLKYPEDAIINYITRNIIILSSNLLVSEALERLRKYPEDYFKDYIFVIDRSGRFLGYIPLHKLLLSSKDTLLGEIVIKPKYVISPGRDREDIIHLFNSCNCRFISVVENKKLIGIITSETALRIVEEERTEDLFKLFSLQEEERVYDPISKSLKNRTPWLIVNLFTAFLNSIVINPFQDLLKSFVLLAVFMPIVAGEAGNATTQTMAIVVRSLAIRDIRPTLYDTIHAIKREIPIAIINSLIVGSIAAIFAYIWKGNLIISLALAIAMFIDLLIAAIMGVLVPILLKKAGSDPAASSTIILTTFTDVFGFLSFLGISAILMKIFGVI